MPKILAIDDKQDNLISISALLKTLIPDCDVITAFSGPEGIQRAVEEGPDVILLDIKMPGMDGFETCRLLKGSESTRHIPVIMLTALKTDTQSRVKGLDIGADAFLSKPIDETELVSQVKVALRIKQAEDALRGERDSLEEMVKERTAALTQEILDRKQAEEELRAANARLHALWGVASLAETDVKTISNHILNTITTMTGSAYGFYGFISEDASVMTIHSWSGEAMKNCSMVDKPSHYPVRDAGIWGEAIRRRAPLIVNDYSAEHPAKKGLPQGHVQLTNLLVVPFMTHGRIASVAAVANRRTPYDQNDVTQLTSFLSSIQAIVDNKRAEESLHESEERFRLLSDLTMEGIVIHKQGIVVDLNASLARVLGYEREELIQKNILELAVHEDDRDIVRENISKDYARPYTVRAVKKNGDVFFAELEARNFQMNGGALRVASVRDITVRKLAEEALKNQKDFLRKVIDTIPAFVCVKTNTGEYALANKALGDAYGTSTEALEGRYDADFSPLPDEVDAFLADDRRVIQSRKPLFIAKEKITFVDGSVHWLSTTKTPLIEDDGACDRLLAVALDITERLRMEAQLQQAQKMEAIGNLAGGIAHDFNNILSPILLHAEMVMMDLPSDNPLMMNMQQIYKSGERARELVQQILTFARVKEKAKIPLKAALIVKEGLKFLRATIPSTIDIQYEPKTDRDTVMADPTEMHQIVMNLCTNAFHSMRDTGGELRISLTEAHLGAEGESGVLDAVPGDYLKISVRDTGPGISPEIIEKIFEPYFTTKKQGEGTGLGLAVIHGIVKSYRGHIAVDSKMGEGSAFHVYLPIVDAHVSPVQEQKAELPRGSERILLVDDEQAALTAIQPLLERLGYRVTARADSLEALLLFRETPEAFDVVITDQTMPGMTGRDIARELMTIRHDIPIILCTGYSEQIDATAARELGIRAFVPKPIAMHEMARTIRNLFD